MNCHHLTGSACNAFLQELLYPLWGNWTTNITTFLNRILLAFVILARVGFQIGFYAHSSCLLCYMTHSCSPCHRCSWVPVISLVILYEFVSGTSKNNSNYLLSSIIFVKYAFFMPFSLCDLLHHSCSILSDLLHYWRTILLCFYDYNICWFIASFYDQSKKKSIGI
jgi:hypothetical protein